jgi:subtilisin family serine protease
MAQQGSQDGEQAQDGERARNGEQTQNGEQTWNAGQGGQGGRPERPSTREQAQVDLILEAFGDEVDVYPPEWRDTGADYLCRRGSFLIRDRDLPRVRDLFDGGRPRFGGINGLTRFQPPDDFRFPDDAPDAPTLTQRYLAYVDWRLGRGVAAPDHLVYVCGVSPCPGKEPEEVPPGIPPDPPVSGDDCDGRGVKVVVVDVGWTPAPHAYWLAGVTGDEEKAFDRSGLIRPYAGHGTFIAGVVRCVAPRAEVVVRGYFDRAGALFESDLVDKLDDALADSPDVISLSAGTRTRNNLPSLAFDVFVEERLNRLKGVVLVAAAGNDADRQYFYPAASPETVSVGALAEHRRHRAAFSNFGGWVDVYAPGEDLVNAYLTGDFTCTEPPHVGERRHFEGMASWSGTSFATPLVAGLIAGRMSATGENARQAADALLAYASEQALSGVGPVLLPGDACASLDHGCSDPCRPCCCTPHR